MKVTLDTIKTNLKELISLDPEGNYKIGRTLTTGEIDDFEKKHNIRLPEEYVEFVTKLGSYGYGPDYGLIFLKDYAELPFRTVNNNLSKPFPFNHAMKDSLLYQYDYDSLLNGALLICDSGCGDFDILIVNGEEYGNVWGDYRVSCNGMLPLPYNGGSGERLNFFEWYNAHLARRIESLKNYKDVNIDAFHKEMSAEREKEAKPNTLSSPGFWEFIRRMLGMGS